MGLIKMCAAANNNNSQSADKNTQAAVLPMTSVSLSGSGVRSAQVTLLDGRQLSVDLTADLVTSQLLQLAATSCRLGDVKHFGIAHRTSAGENHWLHADMRVLEHEVSVPAGESVPNPLQLHFLVRYYPESFRHLTDPMAVELLYQQTKSLVFKGDLDAGDGIFQLAALSLQAARGDYVDDVTACQSLKRSTILPATLTKLKLSLQQCEERVCAEYRRISGTSRGSAIVSYLTLVEKLPGYGVHFYTVSDRSRSACLLGISSRGIAQYTGADKVTPKRLFAWKNLENVTFRDQRFSIEVDEPKKVVHALSSFNVYEEAIISTTAPAAAAATATGGSSAASTATTTTAATAAVNTSVDQQLISAISEPNTQVCVSRRTLGPGHISVHSWFAGCQTACRSVWLTAVSLHQFHIESSRASRAGTLNERDLSDLTRDLCQSVTTHSPPATSSTCSTISPNSSSSSAISSGSSTSTTELLPVSATASSPQLPQLPLLTVDAQQVRVARAEMASALVARRQQLESQLTERLQQLRLLCLREAELTGLLPAETPLQPGEQPPAVRRRLGTSFQLPETLLNRLHTSKEIVSALELDLEIQRKITTAALKLASDATLQKTIRKQRRLSYQMSAQKLRDIECRLKAARHKQKQLSDKQQQQQQQLPKQLARPSSDGEDHHTEDEESAGSTDSGCWRHYCSDISTSSATPASATAASATPASATAASAVVPPPSFSSASISTDKSTAAAAATPVAASLLTPLSAVPHHLHHHQQHQHHHQLQQQQQQQHGGLLRAVTTSLQNESLSAPGSPKLPPRSQSSAMLHQQQQQQQQRLPSATPSSSVCTSLTSSHTGMGYVPSSVYTRCAYRTQQYPTLSRVGTSQQQQQQQQQSLGHDTPILPPPPQYWSADAPLSSHAHLPHHPQQQQQRQPSHHLSVDELECVDASSCDARAPEHLSTVTPLAVTSQQAVVGGSLGRGGGSRRRRLLARPPAAAAAPPSASSCHLVATRVNCHLSYADSPLSSATAAGVATAVTPAATGTGGDGGGRRWQETSLDALEVTQQQQHRYARCVPASLSHLTPLTPLAPLTPLTPLVAASHSVLATPVHVIPLESAATPRSRHATHNSAATANTPVIEARSPANETLIEAGSYQPYRETSKPFEMTDFYKYSERFRRSRTTLSPTSPAAAAAAAGASTSLSAATTTVSPSGSSSSSGCCSGCADTASSASCCSSSELQLQQLQQLAAAVGDTFQSDSGYDWLDTDTKSTAKAIAAAAAGGGAAASAAGANITGGVSAAQARAATLV